MSNKNAIRIIALFLVTCAVFVLALATKERPERVVYFLPHQDDEMVLAGSIYDNIRQEKDVYVVMVTDGGQSHVRNMLNGEEFCEYHKRYHNFEEEGYRELSRQDFVSARNDEFFRSMQTLGVSEDYILFANQGGKHGTDEPSYKDTKLTLEQATEVIQSFYDLIGKGTYITLASEQDESDYSHSDHIMLERALKQFDKIDSKLFFADRKDPGVSTILSAEALDAKKRALEEYFVWKPEEGKFAAGGHSVEERLRHWMENGEEYVVGAF